VTLGNDQLQAAHAEARKLACQVSTANWEYHWEPGEADHVGIREAGQSGERAVAVFLGVEDKYDWHLKKDNDVAGYEVRTRRRGTGRDMGLDPNKKAEIWIHVLPGDSDSEWILAGWITKQKGMSAGTPQTHAGCRAGDLWVETERTRGMDSLPVTKELQQLREGWPVSVIGKPIGQVCQPVADMRGYCCLVLKEDWHRYSAEDSTANDLPWK